MLLERKDWITPKQYFSGCNILAGLKWSSYVLSFVRMSQMCVCVCACKQAQIKQAFSWRIFPPCWAPDGVGRTEACLCRTDVIGPSSPCCTKALGIIASVHTIPIQAGCFAPASPKNNVIFCFRIIKLEFCRKLDRQNLYRPMLRVDWLYNPSRIAFQCIFLSLFCFVLFIRLSYFNALCLTGKTW